MSKKQLIKVKENFADDFGADDISFLGDDFDENTSDFIHNILENNNKQMDIALELTKLVVGQAATKAKEVDVFATYEKAVKVVVASCPMKAEGEEKFDA